jgi:MFS family permease
MSTTHVDISIDRVVSKVAWRLIPILFIAYVINFVDRVNISFAKLQMGQALGLDDVAFGIGAGMFFVGYFFFEVPSNMILERIGARRWVPAIMAFWGVATAALAFVTTPLEFYLIRFFIGFAEAGFFPGIVLFMTYWFPASHRGRMMAIFMTALAISGIIGGPICGAIMQFLDGGAGLAGWQWLMIATGLPALFVGVAIYLMITDRPDDAAWLSEAELSCLKQHLGVTEKPKTSLRAGMVSPWSWNCAGIYFLLVCGGYGLSFWLPTLIQRAGVAQSSTVGLLVALPNIVGAFAMIWLSRHSDKTMERRWHMVLCFGLGVVGYCVLAMGLDSVPMILIGASIAIAGVLPGIPLLWTVPTQMLPPAAAAVGIAIIASVGNLGGFVAPVLVGKISASTGDMAGGFWIIAALLALGGAWAAVSLRGTGADKATA